MLHNRWSTKVPDAHVGCTCSESARTMRGEANAGLGDSGETRNSRLETRNQCQLEADLFRVEVLQKLAVLELVIETRLDDVAGFEFVGALVGAGADIDERLKRFGIQLG